MLLNPKISGGSLQISQHYKHKIAFIELHPTGKCVSCLNYNSIFFLFSHANAHLLLHTHIFFRSPALSQCTNMRVNVIKISFNCRCACVRYSPKNQNSCKIDFVVGNLLSERGKKSESFYSFRFFYLMRSSLNGLPKLS